MISFTTREALCYSHSMTQDGRGKSEESHVALYWCTTPDHDEDWFVVATSEDDAKQFHEEAEGYGEGDASAEFVCLLPPHLQNTETGWPEDELLEACGAEHLPNPGGTRVIRIANKVFAAGDMAGNIAARYGIIPNN